MQTDDNDNDNEARIASIYHMLTMHDPEILSVPEDDENNENISTRDALKAPDAEQFKEAVRKEVWDLTKGPPHPNTIVLLVETRLIEELRDGAPYVQP